MSQNSKSQRAYDLIRGRIAAGEFGPGHRLVLAQVALALDMSVVPVREAVRRLEAEGILVYERNIGARVATIEKDEYTQTMEMLAIIEGAATSLSAPHTTPEQIREARELNKRIEETIDQFDSELFSQLNHEFHGKLYEACPNPYVSELVNEGWAKMSMVRGESTKVTAKRARESVAEHEHIVSLIESGADPLIIEAAVREHRNATRSAVRGEN